METQNIYVIARWKVQPQNLQKVLDTLRELAVHSRREPGNVMYNTYHAADDYTTIWLYEIYQDEEAARAHRASTHFQELALGKIVPLLSEREVIRVLPLV
ncbi:MAG: antibiotic biosynthesis monooxygenase [Bacteroidetes bacterium]|nr:antibiotic biosynthesis monooxygenase [Bacteroidota bacterium]